jgi:hypothetical protein
MYPQKTHSKPPKSVTHLYVRSKIEVSLACFIKLQDKQIFGNMNYLRIQYSTQMLNIS